jgi:F-type H+-transporting ATPase subunit b
MMEHQSAGIDIFKPDIVMSILTWVTFFILLVILKKFAWKPILKGLDDREEHIRKSLQEADQAKEQLAQIEKKKIQILEEAKTQANAIIEQSRKMGSELATQIEGRAKKSAEGIISSAHQEIEVECELARQELRKESVQTAVSLAEKILKENLDTKKNRDLINQAMKNI